MKHRTTYNIWTLALAGLFLAFAASEVAAQEKTSDDDEVISISTRLVSVNVSATSAKGRPAALDGSTLKVYADGVPQETAFFHSQEDPANVVLLVDVSNSMRGSTAKATRDLVYAFLKASDSRNRYTLFVFNSRITKVGEYAGDEAGRAALYDALEKQKYGGGTAIYTAARQTLRDALAAKRSYKTALVLFTDGMDNASPAGQSLAEDLDTFGGYAAAFVIGESTDHDMLGAMSYGTPKSETKRIAEELKKTLGCEAYVASGSMGAFEGVAKRVSQMMRYSVELGFYPKDNAAQPGPHIIRIENRPGGDLNLKGRLRYVIEK